jgi:ketosteroid isomerase-like protein
MDSVALTRAYYDALDGHDYEALADLLAPEFVQRRPDRTFDSRVAFVRFMREERPRTDTTHVVRGEYVAREASGEDEGERGEPGERGETEVVVRGDLRGSDGETLVSFVDVFAVADDRVVELETFTR